MMKLYEINAEIEACIDFETGEILDAERLDALQMERDAKFEGVACWIKNLLSDADAIKAERDALDKREKAARRKADDLKAWLADAMHGEKLATPRAAISFRRSEAVEIEDEYEFAIWAESHGRDHLLTYQRPKVNRAEVKACLKSGDLLQGARIVEKQNIQIK